MLRSLNNSRSIKSSIVSPIRPTYNVSQTQVCLYVYAQECSKALVAWWASWVLAR
jgi:hypothetical protein